MVRVLGPLVGAEGYSVVLKTVNVNIVIMLPKF